MVFSDLQLGDEKGTLNHLVYNAFGMHFWDLSKFDNRNRFTFQFRPKKKLILKFFDDQVTSILPEATMIHEGSEICVKFVAKICWKTEKFTRKDGGYNPIEKYFVKLDLFPQGSG